MDTKEKTRQHGLVPYDPQTFAARLDDRMAHKEISQDQPADACGITRTAIQGWLKGSIPRMQYWHQVEKTLDCSMIYLLFGEQGGSNMPGIDRQSAMVVLKEMERQVFVLKTIIQKPGKPKDPGKPPKEPKPKPA